MNKHFVLLILLLISFSLKAQQQSIVVVSAASGFPVASASIYFKGKSLAISDSMGRVQLPLHEYGKLEVSSVGFETLTFNIRQNNKTNSDTIRLEPTVSSMEDIVIVASTRSGFPIENEPIKVEVLEAEEMAEESTVKPSTVTGIIGDVSGVQMQQLSAASGNANVRIQGLDGRYTQILRDGLPLYDGYSGGFGLMSIPPLDLQQIELIKGSASTLYGGGAIGGLVNMISKKPSFKKEGVFTVNQTTLQETNFNGFLTYRNKKTGYTIYAGATNQSAIDVNKDGFSDVAQNKSFVIHPRLFFYPDAKTTLIVGMTATYDYRYGGDMNVLKKKQDSIHQYYEKNSINRNSWELVAERILSSEKKIILKNSLSHFKRDLQTSTYQFVGGQYDYFSEFSMIINRNKQNWVLGINAIGNRFNKISGDSSYLTAFKNNTIGLFMQWTQKFAEHSTFEIGLRDDYHFKYGNVLLPRLAVFHRLSKAWGVRTGWGAGYKIPDVLTPQLNDYPLTAILPISSSVNLEKSYGYNVEINYKRKWDDVSLFVNQAFFLTTLSNPLISEIFPDGRVSFSNASAPITTRGADTYLKLKWEDWELYGGFTYTYTERKYLSSNRYIPYTPPFRMAYMLTREWEGKARFCMETSYNGRQYKTDYSKTPGYWFLAAMAEYRFNKHIGLVLNCENILDYRQSKKEALFTGSVSNPQFNILWAPIDGRVFNLCLRMGL